MFCLPEAIQPHGKTTKMKNIYNLPAVMTAKQILEASMGAFANHDFTRADGFHITAISEVGMQIRKGDRVENIIFGDTREALETPYAVKFHLDPTW